MGTASFVHELIRSHIKTRILLVPEGVAFPFLIQGSSIALHIAQIVVGPVVVRTHRIQRELLAVDTFVLHLLERRTRPVTVLGADSIVLALALALALVGDPVFRANRIVLDFSRAAFANRRHQFALVGRNGLFDLARVLRVNIADAVLGYLDFFAVGQTLVAVGLIVLAANRGECARAAGVTVEEDALALALQVLDGTGALELAMVVEGDPLGRAHRVVFGFAVARRPARVE